MVVFWRITNRIAHHSLLQRAKAEALAGQFWRCMKDHWENVLSNVFDATAMSGAGCTCTESPA